MRRLLIAVDNLIETSSTPQFMLNRFQYKQLNNKQITSLLEYAWTES